MSEGKKKISKAQQKAVHKYVKNNYDRVDVTFPKGYKEIIREITKETGESINSYIKKAVDERIEKDKKEQG